MVLPCQGSQSRLAHNSLANIATSNMHLFVVDKIVDVSCEPTVRQMHRQINLGRNKVRLQSCPFARNFTGRIHRSHRTNFLLTAYGNLQDNI